MVESIDIKFTRCGVVKLDQIQRCEITSRVVQEHVLGARVGRVDPTIGRACVPFIDGGIELNAWVGARPSGIGDTVPQFLRLDGFAGLGGAAFSISFFFFRTPVKVPV